MEKTNQKFKDDFSKLKIDLNNFLKGEDLEWLGFNWFKARVGM